MQSRTFAIEAADTLGQEILRGQTHRKGFKALAKATCRTCIWLTQTNRCIGKNGSASAPSNAHFVGGAAFHTQPSCVGVGWFVIRQAHQTTSTTVQRITFITDLAYPDGIGNTGIDFLQRPAALATWTASKERSGQTSPCSATFAMTTITGRTFLIQTTNTNARLTAVDFVGRGTNTATFGFAIRRDNARMEAPRSA